MSEEQMKLGIGVNEEEEVEELKMEVESSEIEMAEDVVIVANCNKLNVRATPSKEGTVRKVISKGDELQVLKRYDEWFRIQTVDGLVGFVMSEFVEEN